MKPRRIAPKNEQLTEALQGELATYEKQGLYQNSVTKRSSYRYRGILVLYQRALGDLKLVSVRGGDNEGEECCYGDGVRAF